MSLDHSEAAKLVGAESGTIRAIDKVSKSDIRHWCEVLGDPDPEYTEKIKTGSVLEIAKVLRDLFVLKGDKELSFGERKMLDTARNLLVKELAIAKAHSEEKIMEELRGIFAN